MMESRPASRPRPSSQQYWSAIRRRASIWETAMWRKANTHTQEPGTDVNVTARDRQRSAGAAQELEPATVLLRRLDWTVLRPLASLLGGNERSLVRGPGMELDEVRAY